MDHLIPFVAVAGAGGEVKDGSFTFANAVDTPVITKIIENLKSRGATSGPWLPGLQHLNVQVSQTLNLPEKCVPSNLSPKNPDSPLYPSGFFTLEWIAKYTKYIPTTVVVVVSLDRTDEDIAQEIEELRQALRAARSHIFVIADATGVTDVQQRLSVLRRATGLAPRTGLVSVDNTTETPNFCDSLWSLLCAQAADFFAARSRETRHKRTSSDYDSDLWEARYTLKLALFSEFKADYEGAIRLYQSAYECLQVLEGVDEWLSMCAHKIYLFLIYYQRYSSAWAKFQHHLRLLDDPEWQAQQYKDFADTLAYSVVETWAVAPEPSSALGAVPRPGFLYLKAAHLAKDSKLTETCFQRAIEDFNSMPHSKARALCDYASWLEQNNDSNAAAQHYEQALRALPQNSRMHSEIAAKLSKLDSNNSLASFFLFYNGTGDLPQEANLGAIETPLFEVTGTFLTDTAFIGRPLLCQLTMVPKFSGDLSLETIKVQFSCASVTLTHNPDIIPEPLMRDNKLNLSFNAKRTFEFSVWPQEVGDCEFVDVQIHASKPKLDQRLLVSSTTQVLTDKGIRHRFIAPQRFVEVLTRPQLLSVDTTKIPSVLCAQENTKLEFSIYNDEDEAADAKVVVLWSLLNDGSEPTEFYSTQTQIAAKKSSPFTVDFKAPPSGFNIQICTEYSSESNSSPVSNVTSVEVDVVKPFGVNFTLSAEFHKEQWPNLFVPTDQCYPSPSIRRRWCLYGNVLSMCQDPIVIEKRMFECVSSQASITVLQGWPDVNKEVAYNEQHKVDLHFEATRKDRDLRTFEAEANLSLVWHRVATPEIVNTYLVPKVRLSLPNQEPRVIMCVNIDNETGMIDADYHIENATSHVLNFAISMPSSPIFAIEGYRATTLRLLPFSRQVLKYRFSCNEMPVGKPLPELRVFDTTFKKVLAVIPDSTNVYSEGGALKLKEFSIPL